MLPIIILYSPSSLISNCLASISYLFILIKLLAKCLSKYDSKIILRRFSHKNELIFFRRLIILLAFISVKSSPLAKIPDDDHKLPRYIPLEKCPRPNCPAKADEVCASDGNVYVNECIFNCFKEVCNSLR